jgi:hypothetical protein
MLHRTFHSLGSAVLGLSVALTAACTQDDAALPTAAAFSQTAAQTSNADVAVIADDPSGAGPAIGTVVGSSHLLRTQDGLRAKVRTSGLTPGHIVTLWFVAFQDPSGCIGACDNPAEDLGPGRAALAFGGAQHVPPTGSVTIVGRLDVGGEVVVIDPPPAGDPSADLFDTPIGSEVHLVIRTHGPVLPDLLGEQLGSFNGGCPPNTCASIQAGVHQP